MRRLMLVFGFAPVLPLAACPTGECEGRNDCGVGEICSRDGECIPEPPPGDGLDGGGEGEGEGQPAEGEGEGEGEGNGLDEIVQTETAMTMFVPASATTAHVGFGLPNSAFDEVVPFDLATGQLGSEPLFDFRNGPPCSVDTFFLLEDSTSVPLPAGDEVWFSCLQGGVQIDYGGAFDERITVDNIPSVELARLLPINDNSSAGAEARVLVAARGDNTLREVLLNSSTDQVNTLRDVQVLPGTFTGIMAIYVLLVDDVEFGDVILVYDRDPDGNELPRLLPLQRLPNEEGWLAPEQIADGGSALVTLDLPADTHFAFFREDVGIPDPDGLSFDTADQDIANIVLTRPATEGGIVEFLRYEVEVNAPGTSGFTPLRLQASDASEIVVPLPQERVLFFERSVGGQVEYIYALTNSDHIWRFPLHVNRNDDRVDDVRRAQFNDQSDVPIGIVPFPADLDRVWMAAANRPTIELLDFNASR